jgi:hypothetical protein
MCARRIRTRISGAGVLCCFSAQLACPWHDSIFLKPLHAMKGLRQQRCVRLAGLVLAMHALVSLILLSSALAHCLPAAEYVIGNHQPGAANLHHHNEHHAHNDHGSKTPEPQDGLDDCCGILCQASAGHGLIPAPDPSRITILSYTGQAPAPLYTPPVLTRRWSFLPLGSRAPPTVV